MKKISMIALCMTACFSSTSDASSARCLLEVNKKTYLRGPCRVNVYPDGSFDIGGGKPRVPFAVVTIDSEAKTATAAWNGPQQASHAHWDLGAMERRGGCWVSTAADQKARICAWK